MRIPLLTVAVVAGLAGWPSAQGRVTGMPVPGAERPLSVIVPAGTELDVKLSAALSSGKAKIDERFEAATLVDLMVGSVTAVPAGSLVRGFVSSLRTVSRTNRQGSLALAFEELKIDARTHRLRATVTQVYDPRMSEDLTRIGPGAVSSGASGGVIGSGKAPLVGVLVGVGTIMAAQAGEAELPAGAVLRIRLDQPVDLAPR